MSPPLFIWTVGRREEREGGLWGGWDKASGRMEGIERGPGRTGLWERRGMSSKLW